MPARAMVDLDALEWNSFWDIAEPPEAAAALQDFYGDYAAQAAEQCALGAKRDGRDDDCRFWTAVHAELVGRGSSRTAVV